MFSGLQIKLRNYVQKKMEQYVRDYFAAHPEVRLIVVAGSVGKTSTKTAMATMLGQRYRVRMYEGNHNTHMSAPLSILGIPYPDNIKSFGAWRDVFSAAQKRIMQPADVDIIIQELGTDRPGDIAHFGTYLQPDIAVITAITPEHMEFFGTMEAVAQEELTAANMSKMAIINRDDIEGRFAEYLTNPSITTYGSSDIAEYKFTPQNFALQVGHQGLYSGPEFPQGVPVTVRVLGRHNTRPVVAAATVGVKLGLSPQEIVHGFGLITPIPGRMNLLEGVNSSMLIDDTYNSSPVAAESAVRTFLKLEAPQRIAIIGDMNELGATSAVEHDKLGKMFTPSDVDWVITIGPESEKYLAPAARSQGCQVRSYMNAVQAGGFAKSVLQPGGLVLLKGSQGGVFAEEAGKVLLRDPNRYDQLVRQSPAWLAHKEEFFASLNQ